MDEQTEQPPNSEMKVDVEPETGENFRCGVIAVVGRPSVGKSTLINLLCGHKVSIVTPVPQTTRNRVRGIVTTRAGQLILLDTPGFHDSEKKLNRAMRSLVTEELDDADLILALFDLSREAGPEEHALIEMLRGHEDSVVIALNKADQAHRNETDLRAALEPFAATVHTVSARTGDGTDALLSELIERSPVGPQLYPSEYYTDQEPSFRVSEVIREHAMLHTRQELPHALYVEVTTLHAEKSGNKLSADAVIYVERESQKGIVVGRAGSVIRDIRTKSEKDLSQVFERKVELNLRVKVHPKWRQRDTTIGKLVR